MAGCGNETVHVFRQSVSNCDLIVFASEWAFGPCDPASIATPG